MLVTNVIAYELKRCIKIKIIKLKTLHNAYNTRETYWRFLF